MQEKTEESQSKMCTQLCIVNYSTTTSLIYNYFYFQIFRFRFTGVSAEETVTIIVEKLVIMCSGRRRFHSDGKAAVPDTEDSDVAVQTPSF